MEAAKANVAAGHGLHAERQPAAGQGKAGARREAGPEERRACTGPWPRCTSAWSSPRKPSTTTRRPSTCSRPTRRSSTPTRCSCAKQGKVDRALPLFDKVIADKLYQTPYAAAANAGMCLRDDKRNADAQRYFERALALGPAFVDAVGRPRRPADRAQGNPDAARQPWILPRATAASPPTCCWWACAPRWRRSDCAAAQNYARLLRRDFPNAPQTAAAAAAAGQLRDRPRADERCGGHRQAAARGARAPGAVRCRRGRQPARGPGR